MIFDNIKSELEVNQFEITCMDSSRPWGDFFVIYELRDQKFTNTYLEVLNVSGFKISDKLSPKKSVMAPGKRYSWQFHHRRAEIWRVIQVEAGVQRSPKDTESELEILNVDYTIISQQGERHGLIGLDDYVVIAEISQHIDADNPSYEDDIVGVQDDFGR